MIFCDWLSFQIPWRGSSEVCEAVRVEIDREGEAKPLGKRPVALEGSYSSKLLVVGRSDEMLLVSGNPAKYFQGHNLFGSSSVSALASATALHVLKSLELLRDAEFEDLKAIHQARLPVTRVDLTGMIAFPSRADVLGVIRHHGAHSRSRHGKSEMKGDTVYWGKGSSRWSFKEYSKGQELEAHQLPEGISHREALEDYAEGALRLELTLRRLELRRLGVRFAAQFETRSLEAMFWDYLGRLSMPVQMKLRPAVLDSLPGRLRACYSLWESGTDPRHAYAARTYYRYRRELLEHGIDISVAPLVDEEACAEVIPFVRSVEGRLLGVPEWAREEGLLFDPSPGIGLKLNGEEIPRRDSVYSVG